MKNPIPNIIARMTGRERYVPEIEWSAKSWTHNAFRLFELVCGRKAGIRAENRTSLQIDKDGRKIVLREFYTTEALLVYAEHVVREAIATIARDWKKAASLEWVPVRVYVPALAGGVMPGAPMPYLFAIAFNAGAIGHHNSSSTSPKTFSHTTAGSNRALIVGIHTGQATMPSAFTTTYNGASMSNEGGIISGSNRGTAAYSLIAPATGANTVSVSWSTGSGTLELGIGAVSYTGVDQSDCVEATATDANATDDSLAVTTLTANAWVISIITYRENPALSADSPATERYEGGGASDGQSPTMGYSDRSTTTAGSYTMSWTTSGEAPGNRNHIVLALKAVANTEYNQELTATAVAVTATMTTPKTIVRTLSATAVAVTATLTKVPGKLLSATSEVTAQVLKGLTMTLTATAVGVTATMEATRVFLQALNASVAVTATLTRGAIGKLLESTAVVTATITKTHAYLKTLSSTAEVSATIDAVRGVVLSATVAVTATMTTALGKTLSAIVAVTAKVRPSFWRTKYPAHGDGDDYEIKYPHD